MAQLGVSNYSKTIGTSTVIVSEAKLNDWSERIRLILSNASTGGQVITVSVDADAVAGNGLPLSPGGFISWVRDGSGFPVQQARVTAISSLAGGTLAIYEEVLNKGV
jgi:hypothetical protein